MNDHAKTSGAVGTVVGLLVFGLAAAFALEPPTREQILKYKMDGTLAMRSAQARAIGNHRMPQRMEDRLVRKISGLSLLRKGMTARQVNQVLAPPPVWQGMPTSGTVKILALLIDFSDYAGVSAPEDIGSRLFGDGSGTLPYDSLRNFYRRSSYDQLNIEGNVLGWYTTAYARSTVTETYQGRQDLIKEALDYYDQEGHDFTQYDSDGDGDIDYFCVFWAGPHGEWAEFWWGYFTGFYDSTYRLDGKRLRDYSWQWELYNYPNGTFNPKVIIHETGHALGVPDYYDYDDTVGPDGGVGGLDIMDSSGDHNCFTKFMLDWIEPVVVAGGGRTVELRSSGLYPDALLFMPAAVPGQIFAEFFMVQNRHRTGNDTNLFTGSDGLTVWHVDSRLNGSGSDFLYDNSYTDHKLLRLVQADGLEQIENFDAWADAGDYYKAGMMLGPQTLPNTNRYDGLATGMGLINITGTTSPMSLDVFADDDPPVCGIPNLAPGETVYGTIPVEVTASDDNGVSRVELYTGTTLRDSRTSPPFSFSLDTTLLANGTGTVRAVVYDTIGQAGAASVDINVDNIYAPRSFNASKRLNRSLLLWEYVNVLTWEDNSRNTTATVYRIYLDSGSGRELVTEIPLASGTGSYRYLHRGIDEALTYAYEVVAVGTLGREGAIAAATAR
jgi:M6 family metalloprotease-like protein